MILKVVDHNSPEFWSAVELRRKVLRQPLGLDFTPEELAAEGDYIHCVLIDDQENIVATATGTDYGDGSVKIRQVAVINRMQGQGLGREIMLFAEEIGRQRGFHTAILHARAAVVDFYLKLGYELYGDEFVEVGIPHRKMRKSLNT